MSKSFDCTFDRLGFSSSFDTERAFLSRLRDPAGDRFLLRDAERSLRGFGCDLRDRLRSRLGDDFRPLLRDADRSRRGGERFRDTERSLRGGERLSLFLDTERSLRGSDDFLERLLSLRGGDLRTFRSLDRLRLSLERLRLSRDRLRLSLTARTLFSLERPRERRTGLLISSFDFSFASFLC